jgi:cyanophycin synthetase
MDSIEDIEDALTIDIPQSDALLVQDCRRLTGPGLLWDHAGAVLQLSFTGFAPEQIADLWQTQARRVLNAIEWSDERTTSRTYDGGMNLALSAPMDQLYSAIFVAQTAWSLCAAELLSVPAGDFDALVNDLKSVMARETNPTLIALLNAGRARDIDVLCDDDDLSLGHGTGSQTWPVAALPAPDDVDWPALHNIPVALITGTNGKTTTTRLCAAIAKAAGKIAGLTSTDFVRVGDDILDHGDYSGPGGARLLLRDPRLEIAFLEVARGGILRRGLPIRQAKVAIVTNVANDHLGQYGVNTVPELARAKFAVHRTLTRDGILVLNADDPYVVTEAARTRANICWVSLDVQSPHIQAARNAGHPCAWADQGMIHYFDGKTTVAIMQINDIPLTMKGAARYNILNALAAACAARALGLDNDAIQKGLSSFRNDPADNPGRLNEFNVNGARLFVDFAHNPHSISAVAETLSAMPAKRRIVMLSHAGDRSDQDIRDVTLTALSMKPDLILATELPDYLRGRDTGEVSKLIADTCVEQGLRDEQILRATSPLDAVQQVINLAQPGDAALLLVLSNREQIFELLAPSPT